jgi:hypothetical protein
MRRSVVQWIRQQIKALVPVLQIWEFHQMLPLKHQ